MTPSLSVIVPALNEEKNIANALRDARAMLADAGIADWEVIVVTCPGRDGNRDRTAEIVREASAADPRIRLLDGESFLSLGANYRRAVEAAAKPYVVLFPGDNENDRTTYPALFRAIGSADMVLAYTANPEVRPLHRRLLSRAYVLLLNAMFGRRIRYYNGTNVYRTDQLRTALPESESFAYSAEIVLTLLAKGASYVEVPVRVQFRPGRSKALEFRNVIAVIRSLVALRKKIAAIGETRSAVQDSR